ncbi:tetratricopeptide repeat protein [Kitasatospora sp. NPDC094011]|uniref:tetratricopeptide repeat protein n=1 Tax=Kitasatospora sp. NPDC094011 TaxID=3364090 RepID=UPI0037F24C29
MTAHVRPESGIPDPEPYEQRRRPGTPSGAGGDPHAAVLPPEAARAAQTVGATTPKPNLPPRSSHQLIGREAELRAVAEALAHRDGGGLVTQATTLHGLGGVGKTSLALHHAYARAEDYRLIWWITAESEGQLAEAFAGLAVHLHPAWALTATPGQQVEWAIAWLRAHDRWLLVYDNAEDPAHLTPYVGRLLGCGHQLVTSRRAGGWHPGIRPVRIDVLDAPEAAQLLCGAAYPGVALDPAEQDEARALADELGHLPIALAQAGAYLQQTGTTFAAYRELLRATGPAGPGAESTVARLWRTTLRTVQHTAPFAVELLRTLAWYASEALPREVLTPFGSRRPEEVDRALRLLADYHLITLGDTVTVHRLLQAVLRGSDVRFRARAERHLAAAAVRLWPTARPELRRALLPHVRDLADSGPSPEPTPETVALYGLAAGELTDRAQRVYAVPLVEAMADGQRRLLGEDHPDTLSTLGRLGRLRAQTGDPARAVELCREVVNRRIRVQGADHPATLSDRHTLAQAYRKAGQHTLAIEEFRGVVADRARVLGPDRTETLHSRGSLAYALQVAGQHRESVTELEHLVRDAERLLGADHPEVLTRRNGLAFAQLAAGQHGLSIRLYERVVADRTRVLGPDHPDTLNSRGWLAAAHADTGNHLAAITAFRDVVVDRTRAQGADHPQTLYARKRLASLHRKAGHAARAVAEFDELVPDYTRVLGPDHPHTLNARSGLARAHREAGTPERAVEQHRALVRVRAHVQGESHPDTLEERSFLGYALRVAGRPALEVLAGATRTPRACWPTATASTCTCSDTPSAAGSSARPSSTRPTARPDRPC